MNVRSILLATALLAPIAAKARTLTCADIIAVSERHFPNPRPYTAEDMAIIDAEDALALVYLPDNLLLQGAVWVQVQNACRQYREGGVSDAADRNLVPRAFANVAGSFGYAPVSTSDNVLRALGYSSPAP